MWSQRYVFFSWKLGMEAATISDILNLFGQGNFIFIREKSGFSVKAYVCDNHDLASKKAIFRFPYYSADAAKNSETHNCCAWHFVKKINGVLIYIIL